MLVAILLVRLGMAAKESTPVRKAKLTLGLLMTCALFVPLSECSRGGERPATPPRSKTLVQKIFPRSDAQTDYNYGATRLGPSINGVLTSIAFGWPLLFALLNRRLSGQRRGWILYAFELLLGVGTIYWIYAVTEGGKRLWGAYLVFALTIAYVVAAMVDLGKSVRGAKPHSARS
jgi:hypothetical protein